MVTPSAAAAAEHVTDPAIGEEFGYLPLAELYESPLNPRKHFDQVALDELAESIHANGVLTPLWVRPHQNGKQGKYEIGAGARRFRAAQAVGLEMVPVRIRPMEDPVFLELLTIENLQRADIHPLEEAEGFVSLMQTAGYDVAKIAARVGRSEKYVYDRIKLLQLTPKAKQMFLAGTFEAGHAILLARLSKEDQERAIGDPENVDDYRNDGGLFQHEHVGWEIGDDGRPDYPEADHVKARSVRELKAWIDKNVRFTTEAKQVDAFLHPETAAALETAEEEELKVVHITHEYRVPDGARDEHKRTYGEKSWKRADGRYGSKECDQSCMGVVVAGPGRGDAFRVCIAKKKCDVHWKKERQEAERRKKAAAKGESGGGGTSRWEQDEAKRREQMARAEAKRKRWEKARPALLAAVADKVKTAPIGGKNGLGALVLNAVSTYGIPKGARRLVPRGTTAEDLIRHLAFLDIAAVLGRTWSLPDQAPRVLKQFGLDAGKIVNEAVPAPKAKKRATTKTKATKTAGRRKKR